MQKSNTIPVDLDLSKLISESAKSSGPVLDSSFPVIDLFAGPGGLGEGFGTLLDPEKKRRFRSAVSIECDGYSHQTLLLRHFFRQFPDGQAPDDYYDFLAGDITAEQLFRKWPAQYSHAQQTAQKIKLGPPTHDEVRKLIKERLKGYKLWALVGGPPCQAYSLVGRSRRKEDPKFKTDEKHTLYLEYLRIVADHQPPIFVMENVKGLLSAKINGQSTITRIVRDLRHPKSAGIDAPASLEYRLYSLVSEATPDVDDKVDPKAFMVQAEKYGIPQARHRMFIVGIRSDLNIRPGKLKQSKAPTLRHTIQSLPKIRSVLSYGNDTRDKWIAELNRISELDFMKGSAGKEDLREVRGELRSTVLQNVSRPWKSSSDKYPERAPGRRHVLQSLFDGRLRVLTSHESRAHMAEDLRRYLFAAVYARKNKRSPRLDDFPKELLPDHKNVKKALAGSMFNDRFRVQLANSVSTTVTSHISKDGHYFIHYDPAQCRSLTVREAARLQTFPDNYFFAGPMTKQYHQVGNAVPAHLARQIARIVAEVLDSAKVELED